MKKERTRASKYPDSDYEQFLRSVRPVGLGLLECSCKLEREDYIRLMGQEDKATRTISTEFHLTDLRHGYFDAKGKFSLAVEESEKDKPTLAIDAVYEIHFHCKGSTQKEPAERFVASELRLIMWPYFRELVFDLCGKMSIPPITIPLVASLD